MQTISGAASADTARHRQARRKLAFLLAFALAVAAVGGGGLSLALFTDSDAVGSNTFSTGTISLTASPASALVTFSDMLPGDSTTQPLTLTNAGTGTLRYAMTSSSTNADSKALRSQLTVEIRVKTASACSVDFTGTVVLAATVLDNGVTQAGFGNTTAGAHSGDRTLAAAAAETLCFRVALPSGTGDAYQGAATTTTFTFASEQTANNP